LSHALVLAALIAFAAAGQARAQPRGAAQERPPDSSRPFPHIALPDGTFHSWCGRDGAFLTHKGDGERRQYRLYARDGTEQAAIVPKPETRTSELQCDEKAENLILSNDTMDSVSVSVINLKTQAETVLLQAPAKHVLRPMMASPDARYIAYRADRIDTVDATVAADIGLIAVSGDAIRWSSDSSMVLSVIGSPHTAKTTRADYVISIEIIYAQTGETISGTLPHGYLLQDLFRNAFFINGGAELLLLLSHFDTDEPGGTIFRCRVRGFQCRPVVPVGSGYAMNEAGDIAVSKTLARKQGKRKVIQLIRSTGRTIDVADYSPDSFPGAILSPTGNLLGVRSAVGALCQTRSGPCSAGALFDVSAKDR
jgi:hypothetical protein